MRRFYNTIGLYEGELESANLQAKTQEDLILQVFQNNPDTLFTPFGLQGELEAMGKNYPITSIRRAITNLTKRGFLVKTIAKKPGIYGQLNFLWRYNND
jgi:Fe2+ or Zn2+ uptake regulation protein